MPSQKDLLLRRIVVSGPIGSGKSEVGKLLAARGATVIDADEIGHAVLEPSGGAYDPVAERWPEVVVDGRIDRSALAGIVFADRNELRTLEAITHPLIARRIVATVGTVPEGTVVVELPLTVDLIGESWHRLVIVADAQTRLRRAVARGMDTSDALRRMAAQPPIDVWEASGDSVIVNDGDRAELERSVERWWRRHVAA